MKKTSAELKRCAREILTGNYTVPVASCFITTCISTTLLFPFYINNIAAASTLQRGIYYVASFLITLLGIIFSCGMIRLHLNMAQNRPFQFGDLFYGFRNNPHKIAGAYLLLLLRMLPAALPGSLLLTISLFVFPSSLPLMGISILVMLAGAIWCIRISLQYALIFYLLMEAPDKRVGELFAESRSLMHGNLLRLLYIELSFLGFALLGVLSFGIGKLWVTPYTTQTLTCFFLDVLDEKADSL